MILLKDQHWPQTNGADAASANVGAEALDRLDESDRVRGVEGNVGAAITVNYILLLIVRNDNSPLSLASEVLDVIGVLGRQLLNLGV